MIFKNNRILFIIDHPILGGAERQALGLAKYLSEKRNCKIDLLISKTDSIPLKFRDECREFIGEIFAYNNIYLYFPFSIEFKNIKRLYWILSSIFQITRDLRQNKYEIIIPYMNTSSKIAFFLSRFLISVKITFWHQLGLDVWKNDIIEKIVIKGTHLFIGNAENCISIFREKYRIKEDKLFVLPQFPTLLRIDFDKNDIKAKFNIPSNNIVIGMIAHYRPEKLHNMVLDSFIELTYEFHNIHLIFLGDRNNTESTAHIFDNLVNKVILHKVSHKVNILSGSRVEEILSCIDIGILMSDIEGTPNVVQEYMLYGLPVIATNHPGTKELIRDSSFLIKNDKLILKSKIKELINNSERRSALGESNRKIIKTYTPDNYVLRLENIFSKNA